MAQPKDGETIAILHVRNYGDITVKFFEENNYFNYNKNDVKFFMQGQLPMLGKDGKILLNEEGLVKLAADGHGRSI